MINESDPMRLGKGKIETITGVALLGLSLIMLASQDSATMLFMASKVTSEITLMYGWLTLVTGIGLAVIGIFRQLGVWAFTTAISPLAIYCWIAVWFTLAEQKYFMTLPLALGFFATLLIVVRVRRELSALVDGLKDSLSELSAIKREIEQLKRENKRLKGG